MWGFMNILRTHLSSKVLSNKGSSCMCPTFILRSFFPTSQTSYKGRFIWRVYKIFLNDPCWTKFATTLCCYLKYIKTTLIHIQHTTPPFANCVLALCAYLSSSIWCVVAHFGITEHPISPILPHFHVALSSNYPLKGTTVAIFHTHICIIGSWSVLYM